MAHKCPDCDGKGYTYDAVGKLWCETCHRVGIVDPDGCRKCIIEKGKQVAELEAERQATIEAIIPPNRDKCSDCGHSLVWQWMEGRAAAMTGPSRLVCPRCVLGRAEKAEKERDEAQAFHEGQAERAEDLQESLHKAKGEIARLCEAVKAASACMAWYWENATDAYQAAPMAYEDLDAVLEGTESEDSVEVEVEVEELDEDEEIRKATLHDIVEAAIEETRADKARSEESTAVEKWNPKKPGGNLWRFSRACTRHDAAMHDQNIARQKRRKAVERLGE